MNNPTIFIVAAESGGHILPALHLAEQYKAQHPASKIIFFTGTSNLEKKILDNRQPLTHVIHWSLGKFSLRRWWQIPLLGLQAIALFGKSIFYLFWHRPEKVMSTGGLFSVPLCMAAGLMNKEVEIHELNVIPGKAIKALLPFAHTIHHVFPQTRAYCRWGLINFAAKCHAAQYPLRFTEQDKVIDKNKVIDHINVILAQRNLGQSFDSSRTTLFVLGGSQGSRLLNKLIKDFFQNNHRQGKSVQVIHQIGSFEERSWEQWYEEQEIPAITFSYDNNIGQYYALADLIICRAGAGTLFEIAFFAKPCIVIPLIAATTDHQIHNAYAMAEQYPSLFTVLEQEAVTLNHHLVFDAVNKVL